MEPPLVPDELPKNPNVPDLPDVKTPSLPKIPIEEVNGASTAYETEPEPDILPKRPMTPVIERRQKEFIPPNLTYGAEPLNLPSDELKPPIPADKPKCPVTPVK